jgi:hypothetical protein
LFVTLDLSNNIAHYSTLGIVDKPLMDRGVHRSGLVVFGSMMQGLLNIEKKFQRKFDKIFEGN